ncbi:hypothetical protein [uncultured Legionella sp.]|uniref:hypothetical protein n=1 Tax=uncultured Legionella sp. TaxID=210934 RepID=UPI00261DAA33|nr:hypothetical protein [uncultured Legionella sp.]
MLKKLIGILSVAILSCFAAISVAEDVAEPADVKCKDNNGKPITVKAKTISIYNNTEDTIYPVVSTSMNSVNEWLQGCFRTSIKIAYPTKFVYKLYVNEGTGIAPGSSVTITLPLYSKLSDDLYVTWWNGGRVVLADKNEGLRNKKDVLVNPSPEEVTCQGSGTGCELSIYSSDAQFPENIYAQLSEYTFGDSIMTPEDAAKSPDEQARLLKPENVGYNISYVDHVYMPVAIAPKKNPYIGYSGSTKSMGEFRDKLRSFLNTDAGQGWPVYNLFELKLPGGYNVFAQRFGTLPANDNVPVKPDGKDSAPPVLTVLSCQQGQCTDEQKKSLHFGQAVQRMQNLWGSCVAWDEDVSKYVTEKVDCPDDLQKKLVAIQAFYQKNYQQYLAMYDAGQCNEIKDSKPVPFNYWNTIQHIYGWVPFNEGCGAAANPLANTSIPDWNHAQIQSMYIHYLQYIYNTNIRPELVFNPYVQLIHDKDYLDMDAYAFSVDDAVGFMSELGDGLIFTVGGTNGLENPDHFNYEDGFSVAIGVPQEMSKEVTKPLITKYGVCVYGKEAGNKECDQVTQDVIMPTNSQIAGFRVGTVASYPIKVQFTDLNNNVYTFRVNVKFAPCTDDMNPAKCPINRGNIINKQTCSVTNSKGELHPKSGEWCQNANPNQQKEKQLTKNYLSFPQPVDFMK